MNSYDEIVKSNGPSKVYKEVYIPPDDKHKGFYRKYLVNTNSEKFAKIKARAEAGGATSLLYKVYLNFVKLLEDHAIPNDPKEAHNQLMGYKAKLIKAVALAKTKHPPTPVFAFSDYTQRRLEESIIVPDERYDYSNPQSVSTTRSLQYPGEKDTPYFDLDPKDEVVDFVNKNLVKPLKALKGTIKDHRGLDLNINGTNEHHFYQRAEFRISQYVEQYITEKHYHDLRMTLGYDIRDDDAPPDIKAEFEKFRDVFEQHIRDDVDANADAMAKELCEGLIDTIKNPLWLEEGNNTRRFDDPRKEGSTEFHSKDFTVIVAHSGTLMSFWPNSAGERFAIEQGWRGATPKSDSSDESDNSIPASKWEASGQDHYDFLRRFNKRNFAVGYYPQFDVKAKVFEHIQWSNKTIEYPDNYFIKRSQYEQYNTRQLLEIAAHHNIEVPKQAEGVSRSQYQNQLIDTLISNSGRDVCLDMEGKYYIPPMMKYDSTVFTDYDFSEPAPQSNRQQSSNRPSQNNNRQQNNNRRPPQNSRNQQNSRNSRRSGNAERGSSIGSKDMAALLAFRNTLPH